jgi:hypothetical protein
LKALEEGATVDREGEAEQEEALAALTERVDATDDALNTTETELTGLFQTATAEFESLQGIVDWIAARASPPPHTHTILAAA